MPHHRLLAVVACYDDSTPIDEILDDLHGKDVHHTAPEISEDIGIPWDNRHDAIEVIDHARHSSVTQSQMRAWAEVAKEEAEAARETLVNDHPDGVCAGCGDPADTLATSAGFDGERCLDCAMQAAGDEPIEL